MKPDLVAPDGLSTSTYGAGGFYGTSASAPVAAAAVALVMSRYPELTAPEAADKLRSWAVDDRASWQAPDPAVGAGKLRLPDPNATAGCGGGVLYAFLLPAGLFRRTRRRSRRGRVPREVL
jgi:subtilisin family serine protease